LIKLWPMRLFGEDVTARDRSSLKGLCENSRHREAVTRAVAPTLNATILKADAAPVVPSERELVELDGGRHRSHTGAHAPARGRLVRLLASPRSEHLRGNNTVMQALTCDTFSPHAAKRLVLTRMNSSVFGGVAWPRRLSPQHLTSLSIVTPQAKSPGDAETWRNCSSGSTFS
jgi:hypothetical protein